MKLSVAFLLTACVLHCRVVPLAAGMPLPQDDTQTTPEDDTGGSGTTPGTDALPVLPGVPPDAPPAEPLGTSGAKQQPQPAPPRRDINRLAQWGVAGSTLLLGGLGLHEVWRKIEQHTKRLARLEKGIGGAGGPAAGEGGAAVPGGGTGVLTAAALPATAGGNAMTPAALQEAAKLRLELSGLKDALREMYRYHGGPVTQGDQLKTFLIQGREVAPSLLADFEMANCVADNLFLDIVSNNILLHFPDTSSYTIHF
jgi:hypothetical protein